MENNSSSESDESEQEVIDNESEQEDSDNNSEQEEQETQQTYIQTYIPDILDSIAICRETYFFNLEDQGLDVGDPDYMDYTDEYEVLKFIYEQVANIYTDESLIRILTHIRHYYEITFPEHQRSFELFYILVYPQALMVDRRAAGIVRVEGSTGREIPGSFINFQMNQNFLTNNLINPFNNIINPLNNFDISFNSYIIDHNQDNTFPTQSNRPHLSSPNDIRSSSLLNEIMFLSSIFNMRSNESLLHVLNLMNTVLERGEELNNGQAQTATQLEIKELGSQTYECVGIECKEKNSEFCTICQENYDTDSLVKTLPCGHFFHCECIEPWLLNCSNLCPICRKII